ncbi:lipopolysaccharide biosynthesis protein [Dyadobacter psychrotolerans]|uniref:Lipopolysaccharide biosynthesis protein n=1 Tax=Dyadobacter psychrotolerans TaxID=2541721 RepID=A0A4R5DE50_9BACT|nr:lipopolysaccharide biosynthesis protein [Dyadobacter psychrotolerans]TDE10240.1 lipopolysaccharide biosynthesis protein [Dyadobacter psychrotolerans]
MTEFLQFIKLLYRNRIALIAVPVVTLIICFFLVRELPDIYKSHGSISTGLVDKTEQVLTLADDDQESEINRKFDNLTQMLMLKKVLDQVSYQLLLHDLRSPANQKFTKPGKVIESMDKKTLEKYVSLIDKKLKSREELLPGNKDSDVIISMLKETGYDHGSIASKISVYRVKNSDYISIDAEAADPLLSAFLINTLATEFISFYSNRLLENSNRAITFLTEFLNRKKNALTLEMNGLRNYKIRNRVLNLNEQARSLYGQISEYETKREIAEKDIIAYAAAIRRIDDKFNPADRRYLESALTSVNQDIITTKEQLRSVNELYIRNNFDPKFKGKLDSLQTKLSLQITNASDKYIYSPMVIKEGLVTQKLNLEIELELSSNSVSSIQQELRRLNRKFDALVPNEAEIQEYETGIDIASKEYMEALQRYNNATLESNFPVFLKQAEKALPGNIQPSKKMVLLILSGVISFAFCLFVFFILYFFDKSVNYPLQLANETDLPVIGHLNYLSDGIDLEKIKNEGGSKKSHTIFRNLVRSIRYELDSETPGSKIIVLTGLEEGQDKTLLTIGLAWAFSKINKRVLVIDGNFSYSNITSLNPTGAFVEDLFHDKNLALANVGADGIGILGNRGGDTSLNEIADVYHIKQVLDYLRTKFDVILVEADSMEAMNKAKEWISFADIVVSVFEAGKSIKADDKSKIDYFKSLGSKFPGWVLTGAREVSVKAAKTK